MTEEEREQAEHNAFEAIMFASWSADELRDLEKIAKATNAYDNFMKSKGQPVDNEKEDSELLKRYREAYGFNEEDGHS